MSAATLLAELEAAGVHLTRDGNRLRVRGNPDVDPALYREHIQSSKQPLLRELLQREMVALATAEPENFDRDRLDELCRQWQAMPDAEAVLAELTSVLERGWRWMNDHPHHPEHEAFFDRWLVKLHTYERTCHPTSDTRVA